MIKTLKSFDFKDKNVLLRVDFNVPLKNELIEDNFRIQSSLPTIKYLLDEGASIIIMSHLGRPNGKKIDNLSLQPIGEDLASLLEMPIKFSHNCISEDALDTSLGLKPGEIHLLENLRFHSEEENNEVEFSRKLAGHGSIYINDAFGTIHRSHASNNGVVKHFKHRGIGKLVEKEIQFLDIMLKNPSKPLSLIIGGSKVKTKLEMIDKFLKISDNILIGGGMCFTFIKAKGKNIGKSILEHESIDLAKEIMHKARLNGVKILLPLDVLYGKNLLDELSWPVSSVNEIPDNMMGLDIGPNTVSAFTEILNSSKTIVWNGPLGAFEYEKYENGTKEIAKNLANICKMGCKVIIGGGDTSSAIKKYNLISEMSHVSTGGGASLKLMSGDKLPALIALES
tara:strand:+ start:1067 stop:2254 length:1188 start_codon:yes stop_codon:yes gene_type:complete